MDPVPWGAKSVVRVVERKRSRGHVLAATGQDSFRVAIATVLAGARVAMERGKSTIAC